MRKTILHKILLILLLTFVGCGTSKKKDLEILEQHNFIILLDLSDRLIKDGADQLENDKKIIIEIWKQYREISKSKIYIKSRDIFQVVIADQDSSSYSTSYKMSIQDSLGLNLSIGKLHAANKKKIVNFESNLASQLDELYSKASKYTNPDDYQGADIWKFFNEDISYRLKKGCKNHIYIITDGYLFVKKQRKEIADSFPMVNFKKNDFDLDVCMLEITPKIKTDNEFYRLKSVWSNWYFSMGIKEICFLKRNNLSLIKEEMFDFLNSSEREEFIIKNVKINDLYDEKNSQSTQFKSNKNSGKLTTVSNALVKNRFKENSGYNKQLVPNQIKTSKVKKESSSPLTSISDSEFLDFYITKGIYEVGDKAKSIYLLRIKNILENSFPTKESESFVLLCSCKSRLKSQLYANNMLSEELKHKLDTRCP